MADEKKGRSRVRPQRTKEEETVTIPDSGVPSQSPPSQGVQLGTGSVGLTEPKPLTEEQLAVSVATAVEARPRLTPPTVEGAATGIALEEVTAVGATWRSGVTVSALWSINEIRNAWMHVVGLGWRKLFNGREGAFTALVTLASQARQTGRQIAFREEADGMVYEIYLW
jgi:hypothetical protein